MTSVSAGAVADMKAFSASLGGLIYAFDLYWFIWVYINQPPPALLLLFRPPLPVPD